MNNDRVVELLKDLLERLHGCSDPTCYVCRSMHQDINELADELNLPKQQRDFITPRWLRKKGEGTS